MTSVEIDAIKLLSNCTFVPATGTKRFVRQMESVNSDYELSDKQKSFLWDLVYKFRRQHKNKWFAYYAAEKTGKEMPTDVRWQL